jgi:hypothetical protein
MTIVERDDISAGRSDEAVLEAPDRRSFLRLGAWTAAATAAAGVAGVATAGRAEAANGGNFIIGQANTGTAITSLSGGSSLQVSGGNSYIITGTTHASIAGITTESGGAGVYGKDSSSDGSAIGVWGDGKYGVLGRSNGETGGSQGVRGEARFLNDIGVYGFSSSSSATGGALGVLGSASNLLDTAMEAAHTGGGTALYAHTTSGLAGSFQATTGTAAYLYSASGPAARFAASALPTVPPTTGSWAAGSILMKGGTLYYCWRSGVGTAAKWVRMSGALVPLGTPKRAYDSTKSGGAIAAGSARTITVAKSATKVPVGVSAAALSITVFRTAGAGYITAFSASSSAPSTRTLSWWGRKQSHTTSTIVRLNSSGKIKIKAVKNRTHVLVDVLGYYP